MRSTRQFSITLPNKMADLVRARVRSGQYASESEVVREGLRALQARERALEEWLHQSVGPAYDAVKARPATVLSAEQIRAALAEEKVSFRDEG
ncbi:type II toxin-antitoxin system ParD family antitoxin [Sphingosinicella terrae]|uniref:type II toxin-antitoxin system ParD family antitoxin n=1 Tax=Sphingosinicella terrae TaxID=2172047 RepID=UPI000E0D36A7|nr:type II toxin-antitoxin system ParD family antitoxin [Sphingosinicella terrae]